MVEWLHSIPRLIADNESSIQEECEHSFQELVLDRLARAESSSLPKGVLDLLKEISHAEVIPWVKKVCANLGKKKRLKRTIADSLQVIIKTGEANLCLQRSGQLLRVPGSCCQKCPLILGKPLIGNFFISTGNSLMIMVGLFKVQ